ncbi:MAG: hypothetical protein LBV61_08600 [Burkholderiaceae bacterium]|jgi:hypothetical protein|nr:hypothetical protein [Burkholderiaceae bacterium]
MPTDPASIPAVDVALIHDADEKVLAEQQAFDKSGRQLDRNLRRVAGYGALVVAGILYCVGICLVLQSVGPTPVNVQAPNWHTVIAAFVALFTVPTVLVLAVLRSTSFATKDAQADSLHALIGTKLMSLVDKLIDKFANKMVK